MEVVAKRTSVVRDKLVAGSVRQIVQVKRLYTDSASVR